MMYSYPFFHFPYFRRYPTYPSYSSNHAIVSPPKTSSCKIEKNSTSQKKQPIEACLNETNHDEMFEIFGIKLYYDDILLICLIFFLYQEGVQDDFLFIALVLLLLS